MLLHVDAGQTREDGITAETAGKNSPHK